MSNIRYLDLLAVMHVKKNSERYVDESNDIYPPPLSLSHSSVKVHGFQRIINAMMFLKINRVRELLIEVQTKETDFSLFDTNFYGQNIIEIMALSNMYSNVTYWSNIRDYNELFMTILQNIWTDNLQKLFNDIINGVEGEGNKSSRLIRFTNNLVNRPHMMIALWNYGFRFDIDLISDKCICKTFIKNNTNEEWERYPARLKYHMLLKDRCPITLECIQTPAILSNGTVYEYKYILNHLCNKDTNPMTNEPLIVPNGLTMEIDNKLKSCVGTSKVLYIPEHNTFEVIKLLNKYDAIDRY
jgi:hypothetical protein